MRLQSGLRAVCCRLLMVLCLGPAVAHGEPQASPSPTALADVDKKALRESFLKALQSESKALRQRHRTESAELKASQRARVRELQKSRREYLKSAKFKQASRKERREYGRDFNARFKALNELLAAERKGRKNDQAASLRSLQQDQKRRLEEFDAALAEGRRPSDLLWTAPGR